MKKPQNGQDQASAFWDAHLVENPIHHLACFPAEY